VIVCPRCSKENQPHYKFCLGCGAELPRDAAQQPKSFSAPTPPSGVQSMAPAAAQFGGAASPSPRASAPAAAPVAPATLSCPSCGAQVPANFKFCGSCGHNMEAVQAPPPAAAPAPAAEGSRGVLVLIQPDGTEGDALPLAEGATQLGRETSPAFAGDAYLSPLHATFTFKGGSLHVQDEGSLNGVYLRIAPEVPVELTDGTVFRVGQEILRFEALRREGPGADGVVAMGGPDPGYVGRICLVLGRDSIGNCFPIPPEGAYVGRERGDILFPEDGYVSGLHGRIYPEGGKVYLLDVGSSNGTFVRIQGSTAIPSGTLLLLGQQLFRADY
jgi:pSer/pThr/pTyr-binding forkhead associated (FHA) protein